MDAWHAQVASCDAVISVANTTIHGAGGLNIPTQCLLSVESDWRWLKSSKVFVVIGISVGIVRQSPTNSWDKAFSQIHDWLHAGTPMPNENPFE